MSNSLDLMSLQSQLIELQKKPKGFKLGERTIVDIVQKIATRGKLKFNYTQNGKEYVTNEKLQKEIQDLLKSNKGKIYKLDLNKLLDVNQNAVDANLETLYKTLRGDNQIKLIEGKIVSQYYLNSISEEIIKTLEDNNGSIILTDLSNKYDFSMNWIRNYLTDKINEGKIQGLLYPTRLFTKNYIQLQKNLIRPILCTAIEPTPLSFFNSSYGLDETIVVDLIKECLKEGVKGTFKSNIFEPDVYKQLQKEILLGSLSQNGYVEFSLLNSIGIKDSISFIKDNIKNHKEGVFLSSSFLDKSLKTRFESTFYENVYSSKITNTTLAIEFGLDQEDTNILLESIKFDISSVKIIQSNIVPISFFENLNKKDELKEILEKEVEKNVGEYEKFNKEKDKKRKANEEQELKEREKEEKSKASKKKTATTKDTKKSTKEDNDYKFELSKNAQTSIQEFSKKYILIDDQKDLYDIDLVLDYYNDLLKEFLLGRLKDACDERINKKSSKIGTNSVTTPSASGLFYHTQDENNHEAMYTEIKVLYKSFENMSQLIEANKDKPEFTSLKDLNLSNTAKAFSTYYTKSHLLTFLKQIYLKQITHMKMKQIEIEEFMNTNKRKEMISHFTDTDIKNIFLQLNEALQNKNFNQFIFIFEKHYKDLAASILINDKKKEKSCWEIINSAIEKKIQEKESFLGKSTVKNDYISLVVSLGEKILAKEGFYLPLPNESWSLSIYYQFMLVLQFLSNSSNSGISSEKVSVYNSLNYLLNNKDEKNEDFNAEKVEEAVSYIKKLY